MKRNKLTISLALTFLMIIIILIAIELSKPTSLVKQILDALSFIFSIIATIILVDGYRSGLEEEQKTNRPRVIPINHSFDLKDHDTTGPITTIIFKNINRNPAFDISIKFKLFRYEDVIVEHSEFYSRSYLAPESKFDFHFFGCYDNVKIYIEYKVDSSSKYTIKESIDYSF